MKAVTKIVSLKRLGKILKSKTATLISGSFDPFNAYYNKVLKWASLQSRPLVVIVHTDKAVSIRRGLSKPSSNQNKRAKNVANLDFVDYVVVSKKSAHDKKILKLISPKFLLFQEDNRDFLNRIAGVVSGNFPGINILNSPFKKEVNISLVPSSIFSESTDNPISKRLLELAKLSAGPVGKISATLVLGNKIIAEASNSAGGEHAEKLILDRFAGKDLSDYSLHILIPPCLMCADSIIHSKIKQVYYLFNYGDRMGVELLAKNGISTKKVNV